MSAMIELVVFILDEQEFAVHLSSVEGVVRIVEITPLPKAPDIVSGIINYKGAIIPVMNVRRRCTIQEREIELSDQLIIANIRSARELIPGLKAILVTAYGDNNVRKGIKDMEGCGYLEKPFEPETLNKLIMEVKACKAG